MPGYTHCKPHYIELKKAEWLDNSDINNLGIVKWARECLPEFAFNATPTFHIDIYYNYLRLYDPDFRNKYERLLGIEAFRESAKSTTRDIFVSYVLAHNGETIKLKVGDDIKEFPIQESAIVIISQTSGSAEEFTVRIRNIFTESERLRWYYSFQITEALDSITGQWTRTAFKLNDCFVMAIGSKQMIRGRVKGFSRPSLVFGDDIYSETTVITEESRTSIRKWWNNAVMNSIDNLRGKVVLLGTILHEDTVIVDIERNPMWKTMKIPVMGYVDDSNEVNMDIFHEFIENHMKIDWETSTCILPFDEIKDEIERRSKQRLYYDKVQSQKDWQLRWPERIDLYFLALKFKESVYNNQVAGFYQEYFHIVIPPHEKRFTKDMMVKSPPYDFKHMHGYNWIRFNPDQYEKEDDGWIICNVEIGVDLAGTGKDEAVLSPVASLPDGRVIVLPQSSGKYSIRDDFRMDTSELLRRDKVQVSRSPETTRVGVVDEAFRLALRYKPSVIKVGVSGEEELVVEEMRRVFQENGLYTVYIQSRPQTTREGRKEQRILGTLLPFYETRMVRHTSGLSKLEYQLEYLGRAKHDDCADALECAFFNLSFPENLSLKFFTPIIEDKYSEYRRKKQEFNLTNNWREYA